MSSIVPTPIPTIFQSMVLVAKLQIIWMPFEHSVATLGTYLSIVAIIIDTIIKRLIVTVEAV